VNSKRFRMKVGRLGIAAARGMCHKAGKSAGPPAEPPDPGLARSLDELAGCL
jgi:hypothetical protein